MAADPMFLQSLAFFGAAVLGLVIAAVSALAFWGAISDERPDRELHRAHEDLA